MSTEVTAQPWNGRGNLQNLVAELKRQQDSRVDFVADTRQLWVEPSDGNLHLQPKPGTQVSEFLPSEGLKISESAFAQVCAKQTPSIPVSFARDLAAAHPQTASNLLNDLLPNTCSGDGPRRFVRCLDNRVRAFLSARYRVLDHFDIAFTALDVAQKAGGQVIEASLSDTKMRIAFTANSVFDRLSAVQEGKRGAKRAGLGNVAHGERMGWWNNPSYVDSLPGGPDTVFPLVVVENSETGNGGLNVKVGLLAGICFNGTIIESVVGRAHLGGSMGIGRYTEETRSSESKTIMLKVRDEIRSAFDEKIFRGLVDKVRGSQEVRIESPTMAVDQVIKATDINEESRDSILSYFLQDYQPTAYGLAQAVSRYAQDVDDPASSAVIEETAGRIMTHPQIAV